MSGPSTSVAPLTSWADTEAAVARLAARLPDELKPLADDPAYVARRPAALYYLGRAYYANLNFRKSVDALERYIVVQGAAGQPLLPASAR